MMLYVKTNATTGDWINTDHIVRVTDHEHVTLRVGGEVKKSHWLARIYLLGSPANLVETPYYTAADIVDSVVEGVPLPERY